MNLEEAKRLTKEGKERAEALRVAKITKQIREVEEKIEIASFRGDAYLLMEDLEQEVLSYFAKIGFTVVEKYDYTYSKICWE